MDREQFLEIYYRAVEEGWFCRDGYNGDSSTIDVPKGHGGTIEYGGNIRNLITSDQHCTDEGDVYDYVTTGLTLDEWAVDNYDDGDVFGICWRRYITYDVDFESSTIEFREHGDDTAAGTDFYMIKSGELQSLY